MPNSRYQNAPLPIVENVEAWADPAIPSKRQSGGPTEGDRARGLQWKLVIAMSGWECLVRRRWPGKDHQQCFGEVSVPLDDPIAPPQTESMKRWMDDAVAEISIDEYFCMRPRTKQTVLKWLGGSEITDHEATMQLAWAFRNATAHGYLSPTKILEWDLSLTLERLTRHVCEAVRRGDNR